MGVTWVGRVWWGSLGVSCEDVTGTCTANSADKDRLSSASHLLNMSQTVVKMYLQPSVLLE